jgi:hypothetical protein
VAKAPEPEPEADAFDQFETLPPLAAFLHSRYGGEELAECLRKVEELTREFLEDAADELRQIGLPRVAAIVSAEAKRRPSGIESDPYEPGSYNSQCWRRWWQRTHDRSKPVTASA